MRDRKNYGRAANMTDESATKAAERERRYRSSKTERAVRRSTTSKHDAPTTSLHFNSYSDFSGTLSLSSMKVMPSTAVTRTFDPPNVLTLNCGPPDGGLRRAARRLRRILSCVS